MFFFTLMGCHLESYVFFRQLDKKEQYLQQIIIIVDGGLIKGQKNAHHHIPIPSTLRYLVLMLLQTRLLSRWTLPLNNILAFTNNDGTRTQYRHSSNPNFASCPYRYRADLTKPPAKDPIRQLKCISEPHLVPVPVLYYNSTKPWQYPTKRIRVALLDGQSTCLQEIITKN